MPRRFRRRLRRRRRRTFRKRRIPRLITSSTKLIRATAVDTYAVTYTSGAIAMYPIQGNSIDDTFSVNSNRQILGYDQWKAFYKKAKVLGCKVITTYHNGSSGVILAGITPMSKNQGTTNLTDYEYYMEVPGTTWKMFSPDVDKGTLVAKRSTKKMLKVNNIKDASELEIDLVNETPPTDNYYFHVWSQPFDMTTALTGVQLVVKVEYVILLYDPIIPARSADT